MIGIKPEMKLYSYTIGTFPPRRLFVLADSPLSAGDKISRWIDDNYDGWKATRLINMLTYAKLVPLSADCVVFTEPSISTDNIQKRIDENNT